MVMVEILKPVSQLLTPFTTVVLESNFGAGWIVVVMSLAQASIARLGLI
jgi:hypothetical protein